MQDQRIVNALSGEVSFSQVSYCSSVHHDSVTPIYLKLNYFKTEN